MDVFDIDKGFNDLHLDILGQMERINRLYTQITLCFPNPVDSPSLRAEAIGNLERGLARLSEKLPWVAGKVVRNDDGFMIKPVRTAPSLVVKGVPDHATVTTWDELIRVNFPFHMLDEDVVAPCKTMVEPDEERPVFLVQANFVQGGLLLTFNAQHGSMDMTGQGQIVTLFAKTCRGEDFTKDEVATGNMQRADRIPSADNLRTSKPEEVTQNAEANVKSRAQPSAPSNVVWAYLDFPAASLSSLKKLASQDLVADTAFVSTDDVLSAFIWQSITRVRRPRVDGPRLTPTTMTRNVDIRRHFDLPSTYPGLMTTATSQTYPIDDLVNRKSLGVVASGLRAALNSDSLRNIAISQAMEIARDKDAAAKKSVSALSDPGLDVRLSSWAKEKFYELDFGPCLGQPEAVRRPRFMKGAREGLVYFLPRGRDGAIVVGVCLREEDMERLRTDDEVIQWSTWIG